MSRLLGQALLTTVVAVVAVVTTLLTVPVPAQAATSGPAYLAEARKHTNHERVIRDRRALRTSECLGRYARAQAARMAREGRIGHQELGPIQRACKVGYVGENVAQARGSDTGRGVVAMWMGSKGHKANILSTNYSHYGMGAVRRDGTWWVVQVFGRPS